MRALLRATGARRLVVRPRAFIREPGLFRGQPLHHAGGVGDQRLLALKVARELRDPALELRLALPCALFLRVERVAGKADAVQGRAPARLFLTQGGQRGGGDRLLARGLGLRAGALGDVDEVLVEPPARLGEGSLVLPPGDEPRQRLLAAEGAGKIAVAVRLSRLALEAVDLGVDLLEHVLDPDKSYLRRP